MTIIWGMEFLFSLSKSVDEFTFSESSGFSEPLFVLVTLVSLSSVFWSPFFFGGQLLTVPSNSSEESADFT